MKMTRKWPIDTSTVISNHQTRLKQQHPPLPHVSTNKNTVSFSSCIQGSFNLNCYPLGYQKTNEMNHDNQHMKDIWIFFVAFLFHCFLFPPHPRAVDLSPLPHIGFTPCHFRVSPLRQALEKWYLGSGAPPLGSGCCSGVWVNPGLKSCKKGKNFMYKPYLFLGWVVAIF